MASRRQPKNPKQAEKVVDGRHEVRCASGAGILREEVWQNDKGEVTKYNLAFICPNLYGGDNGRVLGYDNAHEDGTRHERHFKGQVEVVRFTSFEETYERFFAEVEELRDEI